MITDCEKTTTISAKGKNHKSMELNKLKLNNMNLKKCMSVPVEEQTTVYSVTANQQEQHVSK